MTAVRDRVARLTGYALERLDRGDMIGASEALTEAAALTRLAALCDPPPRTASTALWPHL